MHRWALAAVLTLSGGILARPVEDARLQSLQTELVLDTPGRVAACDVLKFTPDGSHLLAAGDDKLVRSWQWTGQRLVQEEPYRWSIFREQRGSIYCLALSPDAKRLAIGGFGLREGSAAVFDRATRRVEHGITRNVLLGRAQSTIWAITFSDRGDRIAYGTDDGTIWLWEPSQPEPRKALRRLGQHPPVREGTNKVRFVRFRDEGTVISAAEDGWVMQWDVRRDGAEPTPLFRFDVATNLVAVAFDSRHNRLAAVGQRKNARAVELRGLDGGKGPVLETPDERSFTYCLAFDPAGNRLAVGTYSTPANARFYKITHGGITIFDLTAEPKALPGPPVSWYPEALAFHPTENLLAVAGGNDHEVAVFDLTRPGGPPLAEEKGPGMCLWGVGLQRAKVRDADGPREALLHALFRQNYGCSHLIVGRDHAGVGSYYGPFDAHHIFDHLPKGALETQPLKIDWTFWCYKCGGMASARTCPHGDEDRLLLSGTKLRKMLSEGGDVPAEFSRPEVLAILREYYAGLAAHEKVEVKLVGHSAR